MKIFQIPTKKVPVRLLLVGGDSLEGQFYVSECGRCGGPGLVSERLNDDDERFMPVSANGKGHLVHKSGIVVVHVDAPLDELDHIEGEGVTHVEVGVHLTGGIVLTGRLPYAMPSSRGRLIDYLNSAPLFIPLEHGASLALFNREQVISVWFHENPDGPADVGV